MKIRTDEERYAEKANKKIKELRIKREKRDIGKRD
jgi:hypothetical protein